MPRRRILDMNEIEARNFFLKPESYCNIPLPDYINLKDVIQYAENLIDGIEDLSNIQYSPKYKKNILT